MRGNWCKNCNTFVEIKKDYTKAIIFGIIYLSAIIISFIVLFPLVGLIITALVVFIIGVFVGVLFDEFDFFEGEKVCIICRKTTVWKRAKKVEEKDDYKNLDWLRYQYYEIGKSIQDIANDQGVSMITIRKWLDKHKPCPHCGSLFSDNLKFCGKCGDPLNN